MWLRRRRHARRKPDVVFPCAATRREAYGYAACCERRRSCADVFISSPGLRRLSLAILRHKKLLTLASPVGTLRGDASRHQAGAALRSARATRQDLPVETLALRHQLGVLARSHTGVNGNYGFSSFTATSDVPPDRQSPSVPAGLSATAVSSSQINLSWLASPDNIATRDYQVFQTGVQVASPAGTSNVTAAPVFVRDSGRLVGPGGVQAFSFRRFIRKASLR